MKKVVILGAGEGGQLLIREVLNNKKELTIIGLFDDNLKLLNQEVVGIKVLGPINDLGEFANKTKIDLIFIAIPSLRGKKLAKIVEIVQETGIHFQVLPGIFESIEYSIKKEVPAGNLRKVELGDLLDRENVTIDIKKVSGYLNDKTVLVVGAGGSIGSELARRLAEFQTKKMVLVDIYENNLYELQDEINYSAAEPTEYSCRTSRIWGLFPKVFIPTASRRGIQPLEINLPNAEYLIADIKDKSIFEDIFNKYKPDVIFHAAAHKHVPLMEKNPREAIQNNILGSNNLIELAIKYKTEKFIFISSDKAVSPTSIMGATKRFTEEQILSLDSKQTNFTIVRFGNVFGSNGSVVPLWQKQLSRGKPLTVTHPDMERYFMSIPEAAQLVVQAGAMANGQEIFVLRMGKQYKILDLAKTYIKLAGLILGENASIKIIGTRPGEKLSEVLSENDEKLVNSSHPMIDKILPRTIKNTRVKSVLEVFKTQIGLLSKDEINDQLKKVIPNFQPYIEFIEPVKSKQIINFSPPAISQEEIKAVVEVMKSGWLTMGPKVLEFEKTFAIFHKKKFAISVSSATAGLHLSLLALGIGPGDEVIVPSYTFVSCANTIVWTGAQPVFVDVERKGFLIDPLEIEKKITKNTKAIMVVHYGGQMADMAKIMKIAKKHNLQVIEDCAHSPGAKFNGKLAGTTGDLGVFSFYPTKNIASAEGGMIITDSADLAQKIKILRLHGMSADAFNRYSKDGHWAYEITEAGFKYNMTDIQAAIGLVQFNKLTTNNQKRLEIANLYREKLRGTFGIELLPETLQARENVWHLYPILVEPKQRDLLIQELKEFNILTSVHFIPIHLQPYYQDKFGYKLGDLPVSESIFEREISLPMHPNLTEKDIVYITDVIKYFLSKS